MYFVGLCGVTMFTSAQEGVHVSECERLHVLRSVGEGRAVLRRRVLGSMWGSVTQHHQHGPVRVDPLRGAEVAHGLGCDQIGQVVLCHAHTDTRNLQWLQ